MNSYQESTLWKRTLGATYSSTIEDLCISELRQAYLIFRKNAATLAGEIPQHLSGYTVHDITHIDALWEYSSMIIGDDYPITPTESFVLGCAFLIHDLGLALAAYPNGLGELKEQQVWKDSYAAASNYSRTTTAAQSTSDDTESIATIQTLRLLHAERASKLATDAFRDKPTDDPIFLLEDQTLRSLYGDIIGRIAASHWWHIGELGRLESLIGAPSHYPLDWKVDQLKLACILRTADACQLDSRRAPSLLRAFRKPRGESSNHWNFQERLTKPITDGNRLTYSASRHFAANDFEAWWCCYDALQVADRELRDSDTLLHDCKRDRFRITGITGAGDAQRIARHIPTQDWHPFDTQYRVSQLASLISKLGGTELYGDKPEVPLRELMQNAMDAVRARRIKENRQDDWGEISIQLFKEEDDSHWIVVSDNGVGMSARVLTGPLLDFGQSYWGSELMRMEHPGLASSKFTATGKYGIGFFSIFMIAESASVTTRCPEDGASDTRVLDFPFGLESRPILRAAKADERLKDPGTSIRLKLRDAERLAERILSAPRYAPHRATYKDFHARIKSSLRSTCDWICPCPDVNILTVEHGKKSFSKAHEWVTLPELDLIGKITATDLSPDDLESDENLKQAIGNIRPIIGEHGKVFGRAAFLPSGMMPWRRKDWLSAMDGVVTAGAFAATRPYFFVGAVLGQADRAARDEATTIASRQSVAQWADDQARLARRVTNVPEELAEIASRVRALGGSVHDLPIAESAKGWVSFQDIVDCMASETEAVLVQDAAWHLGKMDRPTLELKKNVYAASSGIPSSFIDLHGTDLFAEDTDHEWWQFHRFTLEGVVVLALSKAWKCPVALILSESDLYSEKNAVEDVVATDSSGEFIESASRIKRPK